MPNFDELHYLDLAVGAAVLLSAWVAYMRGLVREAFALGTWIGAVAITMYFYPQGRAFTHRHIESDFAADLAAGVGLFVGSFLILRLVGTALAEAIARSEHNALDRSAGFLFGLFRGGLLAVAAYMAFSWFVPPPEQPAWLKEAKVTPMLREGALKLGEILPQGFSDEAEAEAERLRELDRQAAELERLRKGFNQPAPAVPGQDEGAPESGYNQETREAVKELLRRAQESGSDETNQ